MSKKEKKIYKCLAMKLCAAFISNRLGIGTSYAEKNYVDEESLGDTWYLLARALEERSFDH
tara:strand:- start:180 stop:362 length:183 start_codon:yes stop_codon:yes gene_type:complete